jgi:pimeloyl-ACP methyl ester carboxylesterase
MDVTNAMTEDAPVVGYPTVVLVHGAFADASSWNAVIERLQAKGVRVAAPANPLRGISTDSGYIAGVFEQTPGPLLAVGHSYGGAVITNAATQAEMSSASSMSPLSPRKKLKRSPTPSPTRTTASS